MGKHEEKHHQHHDDGSFATKFKEVMRGNLVEDTIEKSIAAAQHMTAGSTAAAIGTAGSAVGAVFTGMDIVDCVSLVMRSAKMFVGKPLTYDQQNELLAVQSGKNQVSIHSTRNLHFRPNTQTINPERSIRISYDHEGRGTVSQGFSLGFSRGI